MHVTAWGLTSHMDMPHAHELIGAYALPYEVINNEVMTTAPPWLTPYRTCTVHLVHVIPTDRRDVLLLHS